jgi:hypothetical protein
MILDLSDIPLTACVLVKGDHILIDCASTPDLIVRPLQILMR